jgi:hypothetical protein
MITKKERHLVLILQGRENDLPSEFRNEDPLDYNDFDVKALVLKLAKNPEDLRSLMNDGKFSRTFEESCNQALVRIAQLEREAAIKAATKKTARSPKQ